MQFLHANIQFTGTTQKQPEMQSHPGCFIRSACFCYWATNKLKQLRAYLYDWLYDSSVVDSSVLAPAPYCRVFDWNIGARVFQPIAACTPAYPPPIWLLLINWMFHFNTNTQCWVKNAYFCCPSWVCVLAMTLVPDRALTRRNSVNRTVEISRGKSQYWC